MTEPLLRHAARALIVDPDLRILLCRFDFTVNGGPVVWAPPGGGVEPGESPVEAMLREFHEEVLHRDLQRQVGLRLGPDLPHVWRHRNLRPSIATGYDGQLDEYYLVRTPAFTPAGVLTAAQLAAESVSALRWWPLIDLQRYSGPDLFGPRDFPARVTALLADGPPPTPIEWTSVPST